MSNEVLVSVICLAYNHERYIRDTLNGFVNQVTSFGYEVFIHDDASTDGTASIIKEYSDRFPSLFIPIFQKENNYSKGIPIMKTYIFPRVKGKYIAICEGDDYWCDSSKLQSQVDWLEAHPDCIMVTHNTERIRPDGTHIDLMVKDVDSGYIDTRNLIMKDSKNPHLSSVMYRTELRKKEWPSFFGLITSDNALRLYAATEGNIYYIDKVMSVYRVMVPGGWNYRLQKDFKQKKKRIENLLLFLPQYDVYTNEKYHQTIEAYINRLSLQLSVYNSDFKSVVYNSKKNHIGFLSCIRYLSLAFYFKTRRFGN